MSRTVEAALGASPGPAPSAPSSRAETAGRVLLLVVLTGLLTAGFQTNAWHIANESWFETHQRDTEAHVVGRMVQARHGGLFSYGGLTGVGVEKPPPPGRRTWPTFRTQEAQYAAFLGETGFPHFAPYFSQVGFQAIAFSVLDAILPVSPAARLWSFGLLTSLSTALCLAAATLWFRLEFGWPAALPVGLSLLLAPWLTVFGRNLWWSLWAFYLPMVVLMFALRRRPLPEMGLGTLGVLVGGTFFVKCLANGYEYLSTAAVMLAVPFFYYSVVQWPGARRWLQQAATLLACTTAAVAASVLILCWQIGSVKGSFGDGVAHLRFAFEHRTQGDPRGEAPFYRLGWREQAGQILETYRNGGIFELAGFPAWEEEPSLRPLARIRFGHLVDTFAAASLLMMALTFAPGLRQHGQKRLALVATTWVALLAPCSWFILFRAHSYVHTNMNYITWHMPFTLFGFALCGLLLQSLAELAVEARARSASR